MFERLMARVTRIPGARGLWCRFPVGSLETRVKYGVFARPHYAYGVYSAAELASRLGLPAISVIEFGVAGGRGLLALESIAMEVSEAVGIKIEVFGFDTGGGMPPPVDYRDLPHVWEQGFYKMDQEALKGSLKHAQLVLGEVADTLPLFVTNRSIPPVGFIAFDLDYYSSTMAAFELFEGEPESHLPRVYCYFDDTIWPEIACHNEYTGELCAINDFNAGHAHLKICPIHQLEKTRVHQDPWCAQMYVAHDFQHPLYGVNITPKGAKHTDLPL